jgi:hypothetical protein
MARQPDPSPAVPNRDAHRQPQGRQQQGERRCLSCRRPFASTGPGNRICRKCKHQDDWKSGVRDFIVHAAS